MSTALRISIGVVLLGMGSVGSLRAQIPGFTLPPGFVATEFAGDDLAHDIYTMTIDARGRVFVAGRGYIRQLIDERGDGKAARAVDIADNPKDGAQGLLVEGDTLYAVGDGALRRFQLGPDGRAIGKSIEQVHVRTGQEHAAHAVRRGPDGWLYLICGDATGAFGKLLPWLAPIKLPVGGFVLRFSPDFRTTELVADGFRNPYDFDFTSDGEPITFDSDNERCVGLPWYEGCRVYHVLPGGHYGWQAPQHATTWRMPPYFIDVVAPILDLGRGSPTGVACYRHRQFPEHYRGGLFLADWTFGRIWFVKLTPQGGSYKGEAEPFLQSSGDLGLAPTALAVHPLTGDLYVSIGGRGTRGAVYRISYPGGERAGFVTPEIARESAAFRERRSLEAEARKPRTLEALAREFASNGQNLMNRFLEQIGSKDRAIRQAAIRLHQPLELYLPRFVTDSMARTTLSYWHLERGLPHVSELAKDPPFSLGGEPEEDLILIRGMQHYFGDIGSPWARGTVFEGYSPRNQSLLETRLRAGAVNVRGIFPNGNLALDRESARLYAMIGKMPGAIEDVCQYLQHELSPIDELHFLIVLARLDGVRSAFVTRQTAAVLLDLDRRYAEAHIQRDRNWPLRMMELHAELCRKDPNLNRMIVDAPDFARPGNAWLTRAPGFDRRKAALKFLDRANHDSTFAWNADIISLLETAPSDLRQSWLDRLWDHGGFEEALLPILASHPRETDRDKFNDGLRSPQRKIADKCLAALERLPPPQSPEELLPIVRALRSLGDSKADAELCDRLAALLRCAAHLKIANDRHAWSEWFAETYPEQAAKLGGDGVDRAAWNRRLAAIDWGKGNALRGLRIFEKANCAACHSGGSAIGPDLHGVAARFSRDDLLTAILEPSKDIAPQYRSVQLVMKDGKVHQGLIVYDSPDGIMLQSGATTTVRVSGNAVESRATTDVSLMPAGLLDKIADGDIADLLAYLRSLK